MPLTISALGLSAFILSGCTPPPRVTARGLLVVTVRADEDAKKAVEIHVPGLDVSLKPSSGATIGPRKSDLSGRFAFGEVPAGTYDVCWSGSGFVAGCVSKQLTATTAWLGDIPVQADTKAGAVLYGQVYLADHSLPRAVHPDVGLNSFAKVSATEGGATVEALVNDQGYYILPAVAPKAVVSATIETESLARSLDPSFAVAGRTHRLDFRLGNHPPEIVGVRATRAGQRVFSASPGETLGLEVAIKDEDGDAVRVRWLPPSGVADPVAASTKWTLGQGKGDNRVDVLVWDGRGGYARETVTVSTLDAPIVFSGRVVDVGGSAVGGAKIQINGQDFVANPQGYFRGGVTERGRYVVNVRHHNYGLWSQVTDSALQGATVTLVPADVQVGNPVTGFTVSERRSGKNCVGPLSARVDRKAFAARLEPRLQNADGVTVKGKVSEEVAAALAYARDRRGECGPGITVTIPPGGLVDADGNIPGGNVDVALSLVDPPSPQQMPGDWTVRDGAGTSLGFAKTFGAASVDVTAGGTSYTLASGATAELRMPIRPEQLASAPATMPLLSYDETNGEWKLDGTWERDGSEYVGKVTHLSTFNADMVKTGQSCVRLDISQLPTTAIQLEITIPGDPGEAPEVRTPFIRSGGTATHTALYNLPEDTDIILVPYEDGTTVPYGTFVVNTGPAQTPTDPNQPDVGSDPADPYPACHGTAVLEVVDVPDPPSPDAFLAGLFNFHAGVLSETFETSDPNPGYVGDTLAAAYRSATERYYDLVDAADLRLTLDAFKSHHDFGDPAAATDDVSTAYANANDLGFGRLMHCRKNGSVVACYVTNFGKFSTPDEDDFEAAVDDLDPGTPDSAGAIATVAMEYAPLEDSGGNPSGPARVKFFVYRGDGTAADGVVDVDETQDADGDGDADPDGSRLVAADLDELGARPVPQLCMVCHGGDALQAWPFPADETAAVNALFTTPAEANLGAHFLPFDLDAFTFVDGYNPPFDRTNQEEEFSYLNAMVKSTEPAGSTIATLIDAFHPGGGFPQTVDPVVPLWNTSASHAAFYKDVFGPTCRGCHAARDASLDFDNPTELEGAEGSVAYRVCQTREMPHARATYLRYWNSLAPNQPAQLQAYGMTEWGWAADECAAIAYYPADDLPDPGDVTFADFQGAMSACSGCHAGAGSPAFVEVPSAGDCSNDGTHIEWDVDVPATYRNVASLEFPSHDLIEPGDPATSWIFEKVNGDPGCGDQMPLGSSLDPDDIVTIQAWILGGATL